MSVHRSPMSSSCLQSVSVWGSSTHQAATMAQFTSEGTKQSVCEVKPCDNGWFCPWSFKFSLDALAGSVSSGCASALLATYILTWFLINLKCLFCVVQATTRTYKMLVKPWLLLRVASTRRKTHWSSLTRAQLSAMDKLLTSRMIKASLPQNSNQWTESLLNNVPSPDDSPCWSFYDPHPPVDLLVHGNTRNHVRRNL